MTSFTREVNQRLAKRPLKTNGRLANRWLTCLVKEATVWCLRPWVRILHSAKEDNLSPFDSNIACLCQSIEINNKHTHIYIYICNWWQDMSHTCMEMERSPGTALVITEDAEACLQRLYPVTIRTVILTTCQFLCVIYCALSLWEDESGILLTNKSTGCLSPDQSRVYLVDVTR